VWSRFEPAGFPPAGPGDRSGWQWLFQNRTCDTPQKLFDDGDGDSNPIRRTAKMARLEAALLVADSALSYRRLAQLATLADAAEARVLIDQLNTAYRHVSCAFSIERVATGVRLMTRPCFSMWLDRLHNRQARNKLSSPMMETLSIVAYRQLITRAEVESIRGVASAEMLKQLMERDLIRITGEDDSLGRPYLYGTTRQFLEEFGLGTLDDLPMARTLRRQEDSGGDGSADTAEPAGSEPVQTETTDGDEHPEPSVEAA